MDLESLIPLIFVALYIIRMITKAKSKKETPNRTARPQQASSPNSSSAPPQKKPFSFEDILKEFEKNLAGEEYVEEKPLPVEEIRYEKPKPKPAPVREPEPSIYQSYEGTTYESLPSSMSKQDEYQRNEKYALQEKSMSEFAKLLRDPQGAKNAIILSEIINRKYF